MYKALSPGALGMRVNSLQEAIDLAYASGFEGVEFDAHELASLLDEHGPEFVLKMFNDANMWPAGWGLPVDWRGDEANWKSDLKGLPRLAAAARVLSCSRCITWVLPSSDERPFEENRRFHIERFKPIAQVLGEHDCRLGLEFIGPKTMRDSHRYEFIYRMEDMLAMAAEIGPNVGLLLDAWHWHTSGGTVEEIRKLTPDQVVYVHVNDAPRGVPLDEHLDNKRCLPGATEVIDIAGFLGALQAIGYDGPVTPEPFGNPATWASDALDACWRRAGLPGQVPPEEEL